jgi:hypothetical protein
MKASAVTHNRQNGKVNSFFLLMFGERKTYCYWCGQQLHNCEKCKGKGTYNNHVCELCDGTGVLCATHDKLWD